MDQQIKALKNLITINAAKIASLEDTLENVKSFDDANRKINDDIMKMARKRFE